MEEASDNSDELKLSAWAPWARSKEECAGGCMVFGVCPQWVSSSGVYFKELFIPLYFILVTSYLSSTVIKGTHRKQTHCVKQVTEEYESEVFGTYTFK